MEARSSLATIVLGLTALVLAGCPSPTPPAGQADLLPVGVSGFQPPHSFCDRTPEGLRITVKNQGRGVPRQVNVTVAFARGGNVPASVGTIQPGTPASTTVQIPAACWHPDCSFEIRVDPANLIGETNETNNNAAGYCIG